MLSFILRPALIVHPFIGFSSNPERTDDDIEHIGRVTHCTPTKLVVEVLGASEVSFDVDGKIVDAPDASGTLGQTRFIQWQGFETHHERSADFREDMLSHAIWQVRAGSTGPLSAPQLASSYRIGDMPLRETAQRLAILGDGRLARFLASEFPQISHYAA